MITSVVFAKFLGLIYVALGLSALMNHGQFKHFVDDLMKNSSLSFFFGFFMVFFGAFIVSFHNVWVESWPVLVTLLGWGALLKGTMLMMMADAFGSFSKKFMAMFPSYFYGLIYLFFGLLFIYYGFFI